MWRRTIFLFLAALVLPIMLLVSGCVEPFAAGFGSGATVMATMGDDAQNKFIEAVNDLNAETAAINAGVEGIDGSILIKPETMAAIKGMKGREKDPVFWIGLVSVLANAGLFGSAFAKRKKE